MRLFAWTPERRRQLLFTPQLAEFHVCTPVTSTRPHIPLIARLWPCRQLPRVLTTMISMTGPPVTFAYGPQRATAKKASFTRRPLWACIVSADLTNAARSPRETVTLSKRRLVDKFAATAAPPPGVPPA